MLAASLLARSKLPTWGSAGRGGVFDRKPKESLPKAPPMAHTIRLDGSTPSEAMTSGLLDTSAYPGGRKPLPRYGTPRAAYQCSNSTGLSKRGSRDYPNQLRYRSDFVDKQVVPPPRSHSVASLTRAAIRLAGTPTPTTAGALRTPGTESGSKACLAGGRTPKSLSLALRRRPTGSAFGPSISSRAAGPSRTASATAWRPSHTAN